MSKPMIRTNADADQVRLPWPSNLTVNGDSNVEVVVATVGPEALAELKTLAADLTERGYNVSAVTTR